MNGPQNRARERLEKGELSLGMGVRLVRNVDIVKAMKTAGYDWLFVDMEHGSMSIETTGEICNAAIGTGIAPIVRVPYGEYTMATRALDAGALGIVIPHVDTAEEAKTIADKLRYPPRGHRSVGGLSAQFEYRPIPLGEQTKLMNDTLLVAVMIETPLAVENCEAIAAVEGVDILLVGGSDLSTELGVPGQLTDPRVVSSVEKVVAACRKHGKWPGMGGAYSEELLRLFVGKGMRFLLAGNDLPVLIAAASAHAATVRKILP